MKRILTVLVILSLLMPLASAKYVTVIFNFPEGESPDLEELVSLPGDANAFHAFLKVAESEGLEMRLTYYQSFDAWLVNGINGIENNSEQYWHFWVNNALAQTGISGYVPQESDVIELGFENEPRGSQNSAAQNALEWLLLNQKQNGEIGNHKVWGNAFALIALNLFPGNEEAKQKAADYLISNQKEDAGFPYPGFDSDALHTSAATMGLIANGYALEGFAKGNTTSIDFLLSKQETDGGFSGWGSSDVDTTSWAVMALEAANRAMPSKNGKTPLDYIISAQNTDGGFGYQKGQSSAEDFTAEALIAFSAAGYSKSTEVENALDWLKGEQNQEGCLSNAYTTALGTIALLSYEENYSKARQCLESMQLPDKGFGRDGENSNAVDTALAIIALSEESLPTERLQGETNPELVPVGRTVKFTVEITNKGKVPAANVSISLHGIPFSWIQLQTSETSIAEIKPNETVEADIYADLKEAGLMEVFAAVSGEGISESRNSNMLSFECAAADLEVSLSMQG